MAGTKRLPELPDADGRRGLSGFPDEVWMGPSHLGARPRRLSNGSTAPSTKLCDPGDAGGLCQDRISKRDQDRRRSLRHAYGDFEKWARVIELTGAKID